MLRNTEIKSGGMDHLGPLEPMQTSTYAFYISTRIIAINAHLSFYCSLSKSMFFCVLHLSRCALSRYMRLHQSQCVLRCRVDKPLNAIMQLPPAKDLRDLWLAILCTYKVGDKTIEIIKLVSVCCKGPSIQFPQ